MKKFLPYLILISALAVSGSAAFYSVYGLGKLFAGASLQVMIMAGSLEFAKLVTATALHRYWKTMNGLMKVYLTIAVFLLIGITSAGIYGFLSSAYQITAAQDAITTKQIGILELKKERFDEQREEFRSEKDGIVANIGELRKSLSNPNTVQYVDKETGQLVTTTSASSRRALENQLTEAVDRRDILSQKIEVVTDSLASLDIAIVEAEANSETSAELGPLKYLSGLTGVSMDRVVNWFILLLIFVFDPLAVTLVILANFAFENMTGTHIVDMVVGSKKESNDQESDVRDSHEPSDIGDDPGREVVMEEVQVPVDPTEDDTQESQESEDRGDRNILDSSLLGGVADRIRKALPRRKKTTPDIPKLTLTQKRNMSHTEIEEWYRKNMVK